MKRSNLNQISLLFSFLSPFSFPYLFSPQKLLDEWTCLSPSDALHLLEAKFADSHVRHVAVRSLDGLSDSDVVLYLPQLLQVFKYELFFW